MIGHELTAMHGLDHAQTLAVILPNVLTVCRQSQREKLLQYAERIWGLNEGDSDRRIDAAIDKARKFFEQMQVKARTKVRAIKLCDVEFVLICSRRIG